MTKVAYSFLTLALLSAPVSAEAWAEKMFKDGRSHDFGTVPRGAQLTHSFTITNIYAVKMDITEIKVGCGCVSATCAKRSLEPRETATVDVKMNTSSLTAPKKVGVRVSVGPQFVSSAELIVNVVPRVDIVLNPGEVNFGVVMKGQAAVKTIDIDYAGSLKWEISDVAVKGGSPLEVTLKEKYRRPGQAGYQLKVSLKDDAPSGAQQHRIYLKTNDPSTPTVPVLVEANVQASLSVAPSSLSLGTVKADTALVRRVVVRGASKFHITNIEGIGKGVELGAALSEKDDTVQFVTFRCKFDEAEPFRRELKIATTLQDEPVTVTIEGVSAK